jgi:hypothetical protein
MTFPDPQCNKNVFQLWKDNGEKLPFKVVRWTWNPRRTVFLVERIEVKKWPYGTAWGRYARDGAQDVEQRQLDNAGSYQWRMVS